VVKQSYPSLWKALPLLRMQKLKVQQLHLGLGWEEPLEEEWSPQGWHRHPQVLLVPFVV